MHSIPSLFSTMCILVFELSEIEFHSRIYYVNSNFFSCCSLSCMLTPSRVFFSQFTRFWRNFIDAGSEICNCKGIRQTYIN